MLAATVALYPACCGDEGGGLTEPTTGALQVVTSITGTVLDPDGYTLTVDDVDNGAIGSAAQRTIAELEPGRAILVHMDHSMDHATLAAQLPDTVVPGYDGLEAGAG